MTRLFALLALIAILVFWLGPKAVQWHSAAPPAGVPEIAGLPLRIAPVASPAGKPLVIFASGDGGWADMDRQMSQDFNADGMSVVGLDTLRYFWKPKTPEQASLDLGRVLTRYDQAWHPSSITLVGFSKGAQVYPFMVSRLPGAQRKKIDAIVLLSPQDDVSFRIHFADWLKPYIGAHLLHRLSGGAPLKPEIDKLSGFTVACFYGVEDHKGGKLCHSLDARRVRVIEMPGKHHFDENYQALVQKIVAVMPAI